MRRRPDENLLYATAASQEGLFTTEQAAQAGFSPQLLAHHVGSGRFTRVRRGIYRLVHFPAGEHEDLVAAWLWSQRAGFVSHESALTLHGVSDALPARIHLTLPSRWKSRRFRVPAGVTLHFSAVPEKERTWFGPVPVTALGRTLNDCARAGLSPDLLGEAARQAIARGLISTKELSDVDRALRPFGGLAA